MVRTIYVVFVESELSNTFGLKRYMFLCPYNCVKEGDIIKDPRYLSLMQVVAIDNCSSRVQGRITLKDIQIETLNGKPLLYNDFHINQQRNEMKNKRNITISLEEAREWYNSGNNTLKEIALKVYSEDELTEYKYIKTQVATLSKWNDIPLHEESKWDTLHKLAIIAKYYNGDWKMETGKTGYFIAKNTFYHSEKKQTYLEQAVSIYFTVTVYAGVVYFKDRESAKKAANILKDELDILF